VCFDLVRFVEVAVAADFAGVEVAVVDVHLVVHEIDNDVEVGFDAHVEVVVAADFAGVVVDVVDVHLVVHELDNDVDVGFDVLVLVVGVNIEPVDVYVVAVVVVCADVHAVAQVRVEQLGECLGESEAVVRI